MTYRVEVTRDETVATGGVAIEITAYIDRVPETPEIGHQRLLRAPKGVWNSRLLFSGGITVARGHAGDNTGRGAIEELIDGETAVSRRTPVFGCALYNPATIAADTEGAWKC